MMIEKLTDSEEIVMKAIWDIGKEPVLSEVVERTNFYGKEWKPQTVSTFLCKLCQKRYLKLQRNGKIYTYKVLVSEHQYKQRLYKHHISFWNHDNVKEFVMEMMENGDLDKEELRELL